ncbi:MAG: hypothetical protein QOF21_2815, partial [Actinomycetota bacterium]
SVFGHLYATPLTLPNGIMPIDGGKFSEELVKVAAVKTPAALPTLP